MVHLKLQYAVLDAIYGTARNTAEDETWCFVSVTVGYNVG